MTIVPIESFSVKDIAAKYGTPTWVYDSAVIEQRISELKSFECVRYAQKANSNLSILKIMKKNGVVVDAVSAGEVERAVKAGYDLKENPEAIVYTADIFDADALDVIRKYSVPVNVGSPDMIQQLGEAGIKVDVTLRINPGFGHGHSQKVNTGGDLSKHGIWHNQIKECIALGEKYGVNVNGLHMHIGSGSDFEHLSEVAGAMVNAAKEFGSNLEIISAGGGLPIPYKKEDTTRIDVEKYFKVWDDARKEVEEIVGGKVRLEVEPGRYLIAESGYLVTKICSKKVTGDNTFLLIDAGFNDLIRPSFYGAYHHISIIPANGELPSETEDVVVAGPLCESCDVFTQEDGGFVVKRTLPKAEVGDYLVLHDAGAYGIVMASNYNTKKIATEVLIHDGKDYEIRQRQTFEDIFRLEKIADYLK